MPQEQPGRQPAKGKDKKALSINELQQQIGQEAEAFKKRADKDGVKIDAAKAKQDLLQRFTEDESVKDLIASGELNTGKLQEMIDGSLQMLQARRSWLSRGWDTTKKALGTTLDAARTVAKKAVGLGWETVKFAGRNWLPITLLAATAFAGWYFQDYLQYWLQRSMTKVGENAVRAGVARDAVVAPPSVTYTEAASSVNELFQNIWKPMKSLGESAAGVIGDTAASVGRPLADNVTRIAKGIAENLPEGAVDPDALKIIPGRSN